MEKLDPAKFNELPHAIVRAAYESRDNIEEVLLELDLYGYKSDRSIARAIIQHAVSEREADLLASTPTSHKVLNKRIDQVLHEQIEATIKEISLYRRLLEYHRVKLEKGEEVERYRIKGMRKTVTPEAAAEYIDLATKRMMEIKRSLSDETKANQQAGDTNIQVNLGSLVDTALRNIEAQELDTIDAIT